MKNIRFFYLKGFIFFGGKTFSIFDEACFRNVRTSIELKCSNIHREYNEIMLYLLQV